MRTRGEGERGGRGGRLWSLRCITKHRCREIGPERREEEDLLVPEDQLNVGVFVQLPRPLAIFNQERRGRKHGALRWGKNNTRNSDFPVSRRGRSPPLYSPSRPSAGEEKRKYARA